MSLPKNVEIKRLLWKSREHLMAGCTSCSRDEGSLANMAVNCQLNILVELIFTSHVLRVYYREVLKVTFGAGVLSDMLRVSREFLYTLF